MDPIITKELEEALKRLGIDASVLAGGMGKMSKATDEAVKSATRQALEKSRAHRQLVAEYEKELKLKGASNRQAKIEAEAIAKRIEQEEDLFKQNEESARQQKVLDGQREAGVKKLLSNFSSLGSSILSSTQSFYASDKAFTAASGTLDVLANATKAVIEAASLALSGVSVLGVSAGRASEGLGKLGAAAVDVAVQTAKMQLEMSQNYVDAFNKVSAVGVAFGGNLGELSKAAHQGGLDLRTYSEFVVNNIDSLAQMGGTVEQAATKVTKMSKSAIEGNERLLTLYGGFSNVNDALAGYNRILSITGVDTVKNQDAISASSSGYLVNLKMLQELTGKSAKALQAEQEEALKDVAFKQKIAELQEQGPEGIRQAQALLDQEILVRRTYGKQAANLYKEQVANDGQVISKSGNLYRAMNSAAAKAVEGYRQNAKLDGEERQKANSAVTDATNAGIREQLKSQRRIIQVGQYGNSEVAKQITDSASELIDTESIRKGTTAATEGAVKNLKKPVDQATKDYGSLLKSNMEGRIALDNITEENLGKMAEVATKLTDMQVRLIETFGPKFTTAVNYAIDGLLALGDALPGGKKRPTTAGVGEGQGTVDTSTGAVKYDTKESQERSEKAIAKSRDDAIIANSKEFKAWQDKMGAHFWQKGAQHKEFGVAAFQKANEETAKVLLQQAKDEKAASVKSAELKKPAEAKTDKAKPAETKKDPALVASAKVEQKAAQEKLYAAELEFTTAQQKVELAKDAYLSDKSASNFRIHKAAVAEATLAKKNVDVAKSESDAANLKLQTAQAAIASTKKSELSSELAEAQKASLVDKRTLVATTKEAQAAKLRLNEAQLDYEKNKSAANKKKFDEAAAESKEADHKLEIAKLTEQESKLKVESIQRKVDTLAAAPTGAGKAGVAAPAEKATASGTTAAARPAATPGADEPKFPAGAGKSEAPKLASVKSKSGKSAQVGAQYAGTFQSLIDYLDGVGYEINSLGGYVDRDVRGKPGVKSVHAKGGALDINPGANPLGGSLVTDMPANIGQVANSLGLGWGGDWKSIKDAMHFSVAKNEGGTIQAKEGGIAKGPDSGYPATLHGEEAIVPLNKDKPVPVQMDLSELTNLLTEMVRALKDQNYTSQKILQASA